MLLRRLDEEEVTTERGLLADMAEKARVMKKADAACEDARSRLIAGIGSASGFIVSAVLVALGAPAWSLLLGAAWFGLGGVVHAAQAIKHRKHAERELDLAKAQVQAWLAAHEETRWRS